MHTTTSNNTPMITVMGATGHTGRRIAQQLLAAGLRVRALGRNADKLAELARAGAEVRAGDLTDAAFLADAFTGAAAVYTLLPTDRTAADYRGEQDRQGEAIVAALRTAGVRHVVALSSLGAEHDDAPGVIGGLAKQEHRLRALGVNVLLLRPVSFFENVCDSLPLVHAQGIVADGLAIDVAQPMVAAADIARAAADALAQRDWTGVRVRELLGPCDLSPRETTRILGAALGKPELAYIELPGDALVGALVEAGLSESFANEYRAMVAAMNDGNLAGGRARTPDDGTTTYEAFAAELARATR